MLMQTSTRTFAVFQPRSAASFLSGGPVRQLLAASRQSLSQGSKWQPPLWAKHRVRKTFTTGARASHPGEVPAPAPPPPPRPPPMGTPSVAPFGSWKSPLTAVAVTSSSPKYGGLAVEEGGSLLWQWSLPSEGGRFAIFRKNTGGEAATEEVTPPSSNVRTTVHEYGGGAWTLSGSLLIFSEFADQRLYLLDLSAPAGGPKPISPPSEKRGLRYADGVVDSRRNRFICVREDHTRGGPEPTNEIVALPLDQEAASATVLVQGADFYCSPRLSPDGARLAWVQWSHPSMPWDSAQLWVGTLGPDGSISSQVCVAGGDPAIKEAPTEPVWSPKGQLFFVSDRGNGFWNLHTWVEDEGSAGGGEVVALSSLEAEFAGPHWVFGGTNYVFVGDGSQIVCSYSQSGLSSLSLLDVETRTFTPISTPFTYVHSLTAGAGKVYALMASSSSSVCCVEVELGPSPSASTVVWSPSAVDPHLRPYLSTPEPVTFPTVVPGESAHAIFYPPCNADYGGPEGEKPPLLVKIHGGPTAATDTSLKLSIQYWTSRGWAVADVNYGGSTGYGRAYRERLLGKWGVVDVDDCCSCAEYLVASGRVDGSRLAIDGGSAGGFTALAALILRDTFKAAASFYGVTDLQSLATDTHKFEARYLDSLVGPWPEGKAVYIERSPLTHVDKLNKPIILFQGLDDKVVPPSQARMMYDAAKSRGVPVALVEYEGESHGFRQAKNMQSTLEWEMLFFSRVFGGFQPADEIAPLAIDNLPE